MTFPPRPDPTFPLLPTVNGSLDTLTKLLTQFNEAKLDPKTGPFHLGSSHFRSTAQLIDSLPLLAFLVLSTVEVVIAPPALYIIPLRDHARKVR